MTTRHNFYFIAAAGIALCLRFSPAAAQAEPSGAASGPKAPPVASWLTPSIVGPPPLTPGQSKDTQPIPDLGVKFGNVKNIVGHVSAYRSGVPQNEFIFVPLNVGDAVYKSDEIQTWGNSSVSIDFPDGTTLNLLANTRMKLDEYSYDPNGTSNMALFTLLHGMFSFIAGKIAQDGNMRVTTPAAVGIRGPVQRKASQK